MTRSTAIGARARQRKLSTKQLLRIVRESEIDETDDEAQKNLQKVETGVDPEEDKEIHLQKVIRASQAAVHGANVAHEYIPTPDAVASKIKYDELYPPTFSQPATYIRFSSTLEDCIGCPYNMTDEDEVFLKSMNQKRNASTQCTEDQFEEVMSFFEETTEEKQPFAKLDGAPVLKFEEFESLFDETISEISRPFASEVYEHWRKQRLESRNCRLQPVIKVPRLDDEKISPEDEQDAYTCFRRPKPRAARRTRGRDAQSAEKLKKLRKELEDARQLIALVKQRELYHKDILAVDRQIFEQRAGVKTIKRKLGIKGDDDDLINQKTKRKPLEVPPLQRPSAQRIFQRSDGKLPDADLYAYEDLLIEREIEIKREIEMKCLKHKQWNEGWIDATRAPLTPKSEQSIQNIGAQFRAAITAYNLPTPPASTSSQDDGEAEHDEPKPPSPDPDRNSSVAVRYASPTYEEPRRSHASYRRRMGRGGRIMIDRRGMHLQSHDGVSQAELDRFKFDQDDDDELIYRVDPWDARRMKYRASFWGSTRDREMAQQAAAARRAAAAANAQQIAAP
ncbi:MAG: Enhancer of polycomb-like protein 1 [Cirrosporium novae-zelandiae]|nr:MAG: Enhancer of polycomb-like protein 1 [Cirrosporium novae-zelandiae]